MTSCRDTPHQVLCVNCDEIVYTCIKLCLVVFFYLDQCSNSTVISVQENNRFSKTVLVKGVVYQADHSVGTFARDLSLISEVVYLTC